MNPDTDTRKSILVVDDEAIVVALIRDTLSDQEFEVHTAHSGNDALKLIGEKPIDLLISDIRMPGMTGIELARAAREHHNDLEVIFVTGYADLTSAKDAIQQGAFDYIMKPFELSEIRAAVAKAFEKKKSSNSHSSEAQLTSLSQMNNLLFSANDVSSLVASTLRFTMMQQLADQGMAVVIDREQQDFVIITIDHQNQTESRLPLEPLKSVVECLNSSNAVKTEVMVDPLSHPAGQVVLEAGIYQDVTPAWKGPEQPVIVVPIRRPDRWHGWAVLGYRDEPTKISAANLKYLDIAAMQLAISLENLTLLHESQKAYSTLKELQDQTIELEKMATRGMMSAEIGHEMNNFLAVVSGNLSLLQVQIGKQKFDNVERYVGAINDTIDKMTVFTRNLMDLTPMSSKKEETSFEKLLSEVLSYIRVQKRFRGIDIEAPPDFGTFPFEADIVQIQQLLYNLFNNAADAMVGSEVRRIVVALDRGNDAEHFVLSISDTGVGFDPELAAKAFQERFTTKPTGHGFGLVVCKRIIENHGGALELQSQPGRGTTISITFPVDTGEDKTDPDQTCKLKLLATV